MFVFFEEKNKSILEAISEGEVTFRIDPNNSKQSIILEAPAEITKKRLRLEDPEHKATAQKVHDWMVEVLQKLEPALSRLVNEEYDVSAVEAELKEEKSQQQDPA